MLFENGENVVVQELDIGGFMIVVPEEKLDILTDSLDSADIPYETQENDMNIDDMDQDMSTATVLTFGPHADTAALQRILDNID